MKKILSIIIILIINFTYVNAQGPDWEWTKTATNSAVYGDVTKTDLSGNNYVGGSFDYGFATVGNITLTGGNINGRDIFIAKFDSVGNAIWAKPAFGLRTTVLDANFCSDISFDGAGNFYATGFFEGSVIFEHDTLSDNGRSGNIFIAKYDTSGNLIWIRQEGDVGILDPKISSDMNGNCYLTGTVGDTAVFGNDTLYTNGRRDMFIAKYNSIGSLIWLKKIWGTNDDTEGCGIGVDAFGNCYVTGYLHCDTTYIEQDTMINRGFDIFLAKYDSSGRLIWFKQGGGTGSDFSEEISLDGSNHCYWTGEFYSPAVFGNDTIVAMNGAHKGLFIAKYDSAGNEIWVRSASDSGQAEAGRIFAEGNGSCYICGGFYDTLRFGIDTFLVSSGESDIFIAKYDSSGNLKFVRTAGGVNFDYGKSISGDNKGNCYVTGNFYSGVGIFGTDTLSGANAGPFFLSKIGCNCSPPVISLSGNFLQSTLAENYQWFYNGNLISGANAQTYLPALNGNYTVAIIDTNGCGASSSYQITTLPPTAAFVASDTNVCAFNCIGFISHSQNATSYQWLFPGAMPTSDTTANPQNICYNNSGNYDVTLIVTNSNGSDTLVFSNRITVYALPPSFTVFQNADTLFAPTGYSSYQWYLNNTAIGNATGYYYILNQNGTYNVVVTDSNGCHINDSLQVINVGIQGTINAGEFALYPNPSATGIFNIQLKDKSDEIKSIEVTDLTGRIVYAHYRNIYEVNIADVTEGIYFYTVRTKAGKIFNGKLVRE